MTEAYESANAFGLAEAAAIQERWRQSEAGRRTIARLIGPTPEAPHYPYIPTSMALRDCVEITEPSTAELRGAKAI